MKRKASPAKRTRKTPQKPQAVVQTEPTPEPLPLEAEPEPVDTTPVQPETGGQRIERERLERVARELRERGSAL